MKKLYILFPLLLTTTIVLGQDTTNIILQHIDGETIGKFIVNNMWPILLLIYGFVNEWLANTNKIKEGSIGVLILNFIGTLLGRKAGVIKSKKGKYMNSGEIRKAKGIINN
jgi:hypothetical protein